MQKVTIKEIKTKTGTSGKGKWTLVIITGEDGAEFTSFDASLEKYGPGSVIEIEPEVVTKDGKTKVNIKEWKLVSEAPAVTPKIASKEDEMTKEEWAERERVKRRSIERQAAATIAATLQPVGMVNVDKLILDAESIYKFISGEPKTATSKATPEQDWERMGKERKPNPPETAQDEQGKAPKANRDPDTLKTIHEMQKAVHADFGLQPKDQLKELNINSWPELTLTPAEAYRQIAATRT